MTKPAGRELEHPDAAESEGPRTAPSLDLQIRHLHTRDDYLACVALQNDTWGAEFSERVPTAILKVSQRIGGITAGAFDARGRLVGFVFGMTGVERGRLVHWSDMLAVRSELRDHGIGRRLKEFQREALRQLGVQTIYWTFDPLVARNAHLNFNRLGVHVVEYIADMYGGNTDSEMHRGIGSDRFVVAWHIAEADAQSQRVRTAWTPLAATRETRILNASHGGGVPTIPQLPEGPAEPTVRVEIPLEIDRVQAASLSAATRWRSATRTALTWAMRNHYGVDGFYRDERAGCAFYVLSRRPPSVRDV